MMTQAIIDHKTALLEKALVLKWKVRASLRLYIMRGLPQDINGKQTKQTTVVQVSLVLRWGGYDSGLR